MEGTIGEVRLFAGNFPPKYWAFCRGQIVSVSQNVALYSVLGNMYGGDGRTTFALPNLAGPIEDSGDFCQYIICLQGYYPQRP